jgi:hypothetical protein
MTEKKTWKGIQVNHFQVQGEIIADPIFNGDYAFMTIRTMIVQRDANGQIVELDQDIPLMVEPGSPNFKVVQSFVKTGRKLMAWCQYKSWDGGESGQQHAFVVRKLDLGDKPYEGPPAESTPPLPQ